MIYGWLIDWPADSTVRGLTNWLIDLWLIDRLTNWLYCVGTYQVIEWFDWLVDWLNNWLYCEGTDHLTEWFVGDWLTYWLTDWPTANWVIHWVTENNTMWLTLLSENWLTHWILIQLIDWLNNWLYCQRLTNWLNDLWLVDWLPDWLID